MSHQWNSVRWKFLRNRKWYRQNNHFQIKSSRPATSGLVAMLNSTTLRLFWCLSAFNPANSGEFWSCICFFKILTWNQGEGVAKKRPNKPLNRPSFRRKKNLAETEVFWLYFQLSVLETDVFWLSTLSATKGFFSLSFWDIWWKISLAILILSRVALLGRKAPWLCEMNMGMIGLRQLVRILKMILFKTLHKLIGQKSLRRFGVSPFRTRVITVLLAFWGILPTRRMQQWGYGRPI